jgi:biopolymer transport protein ExbD
MLNLKKRTIDSEIPSSSMADIAFLLIVFFMVTTVFSATRGLEFQVPREDDAIVIEPEEAVLIVIGPDTKLTVDGDPMELDGVLAYLAPKLARNPNKPVILQTDPKAPYYAMVSVMDELQQGKEKLKLVKDINVAIPTQREIEEQWGGLI